MLIPLGFSLAKYEVSLSGDSEVMIFTLGHEVGVPGIGAANSLFDALTDTVPAANWGTNFTLLGVELVAGTQTQGKGPYLSFHSDLAAVAGTSAAKRSPNNTAALVRKDTSTPGRRGRGRMFLPGWIPDANIAENGNIDSAVRTTRQGLLNTWHARLLTDGLDPVLFHDTAPEAPSAVNSFTLAPKMATQRRRMRP